jgi:ParB/RepB/Spo0J family partition protein
MNAPDPIAQIQRAAIDGAVHIPLELLRASPTNPRKHFDQAHLDELADSIRKHGVIQPILARLAPAAKRGEPLYEVIAGERRWRASKIAGAPSIPALVRDMSDFEVLELQVIENLQREDLHPLEEAEGFAALLRRPDGLQGYASAEEIAARIGRSERHVYNRLALLKLVPEVRELCWEGKLSASVALVASALPADNQLRFAEECIRGWNGESLSARAAAARARQSYSTVLARCGFDVADAQLVPAAGACSTCPKRTAANPDLFTDEPSGADRCLDYDCFKGKLSAHHAERLRVLRGQGATVLSEDEALKLMPYGPQSLRGAHELDAPCVLATSGKPLRKLLGEDFTGVLVIDRHEHLYEVAREADVKKALKAKGLLKPPASKAAPLQQQPDALLPKPAKGKALTPADIKAARKRAIAERWPELATQQLGKHLMEREDRTFTDRMKRVMVAMLLQASNGDVRSLLAAAGVMLPPRAIGWQESTKQIDQAILGATPQQLYALTVLAIAEADEYELRQNPKADVPLTIVARELGFDLAAAKAEATAEIEQRMAAELEQLKAPAPAPAAKKAAAKKPAKAKDATEAFVEAHAAPKAGALKPTVKYRCPATGSTWSGRGLQPAWVKAALASGKKLDELLATAEEAAA